jgi:hypothetical protein
VGCIRTSRSSSRSARSSRTSNSDPLDCVGGVINDLTADSKGGVYYLDGRRLSRQRGGRRDEVHGENINPNGIVLSADERRFT